MGYRTAGWATCSDCSELRPDSQLYLAGGNRVLCHACHIVDDIRRHCAAIAARPKHLRTWLFGITLGALTLAAALYLSGQALFHSWLRAVSLFGGGC